MKKLKNKRGFSLVELMVVVAIMGVLASIAIPAFNSYRKAAKKNSYKADLTSLHKGWQAFGVELDSYCERSTAPTNASISNVGMEALLSSKFYGDTSNAVNASCTAGTTCTSPTLAPAGCTPDNSGTPCTSCDCGLLTNDATFTAYRPAGQGPGKENFIGFGAETCANISAIADIQEKKGTTTHDTGCDLTVDTYELGVYGHISGGTYYGVSINNNGVVSPEVEKTNAPTSADSRCS